MDVTRADRMYDRWGDAVERSPRLGAGGGEMIDGVVLQVPSWTWSTGALIALVIAAAAGGAFGAAVGALRRSSSPASSCCWARARGSRRTGHAIQRTGQRGTGLRRHRRRRVRPVTGPHVGFAAGVAATAYAAKKYPEMEPDWDYHFGKNILYAFGTKPDILAVGAAFGVLGMLIARIFGGFGVPIDGIAFSVVATAFLARLVFGYPLVGSPAGNGYFDMTPYRAGRTPRRRKRPAGRRAVAAPAVQSGPASRPSASSAASSVGGRG